MKPALTKGAEIILPILAASYLFKILNLRALPNDHIHKVSGGKEENPFEYEQDLLKQFKKQRR